MKHTKPRNYLHVFAFVHEKPSDKNTLDKNKTKKENILISCDEKHPSEEWVQGECSNSYRGYTPFKI